MAERMVQYGRLQLAHFGVNDHFWLMRPDSDVAPYHKAISILKRLPSLKSVADQATCVENCMRAIDEAVAEFHAGSEGAPNMKAEKNMVTAEDLTPIMAYVVLRSGVWNVKSLLDKLDRALGPDSGFGPVGYAMVTIYTAAAFILNGLGASTIAEDCKSAEKALAKVRKAEAQQMAALETDWIDVPHNGPSNDPVAAPSAVPGPVPATQVAPAQGWGSYLASLVPSMCYS